MNISFRICIASSTILIHFLNIHFQWKQITVPLGVDFTNLHFGGNVKELRTNVCSSSITYGQNFIPTKITYYVCKLERVCAYLRANILRLNE